MRSGAERTRLDAMPEASRTINLEIDDEQGPLRGRIAEEGGTSHEFDGWLGLLTVLGCLLDGPAPAPSSRRRSKPPE